MILSVTCVFVVLWYHLCLSGKGLGSSTAILLFLKKKIVTEFSEF